MLARPIASVAILLAGSSASAAASANKSSPAASASAAKADATRFDFLRAMTKRTNKTRGGGRRRRLKQKDFEAELRGDSRRSKELRKKMIERSTVVKPPGSGADAAAAATVGSETKKAEKGGAARRKLQNANNYQYQDQDGNYYQDQSANYKYDETNDGSDDYFMAYGEWENTFGFDPTQYSVSYHRCASVRQFDDEIAASEDTDSVWSTKHFAVFRFCPEQTCMGFVYDDAQCGCEAQCEAVIEEIANNNGNNGNNGNNDDDSSEENCEEACQDQCMIFQQQYFMGNGMSDQAQASQQEQAANADGGERKLQNYNNGNNNNANNNNANANWYNNNGGYQENKFNAYAFDPFYGDPNEEQEPMGARGEGCQSNYGEYMIEIKDYLELMAEWQEERFEQYCEYCEECMYAVYQQWLKNGGNNNRHLTFEDFKNSEEHQKIRDLNNNNNQQRNYQYNKQYYQVCPEYDTCVEYSYTCEQEVEDQFSDYFECQEVERNNGQVAYIGPHCAEDGYEITLGVYSDEYCSEYIGNGVSLANFLGQELEEDALKSYYNSAYGPTLDQLQWVNEEQVCIPCKKGDNMWEEGDNYNVQEGNADDDQQNQQYQYEEDEISELCENLYQVSARCDKHYRAYNSKSKMAKYAEAVAQEDLTCDFIDSVVMGNYNEMGFVNLGDNYQIEKQSGWMGNNMYAQQIGTRIAEVTPLQIFGLVMSILAVVILGAWSASLHKSLSKRGPWRPRRGLNNVVEPSHAARDLSRQNSGIVMGRSQTDSSYYMT